MTTSTEQKINLNNCTHEALFKAITRIDAKIATTSVKDKDQVSHSISRFQSSDSKNVAVTAAALAEAAAPHTRRASIGTPRLPVEVTVCFVYSA